MGGPSSELNQHKTLRGQGLSDARRSSEAAKRYHIARARLESWYQGGKAETSAGIEAGPQHQQHERCVARHPEHHRLLKQEHCCQMSDKRSECPLTSVSTPGISEAAETLLRVNMSEAAGPDKKTWLFTEDILLA